MHEKPRLLIFGAGVIGSLYALRFIQSGMDVTVLARGNRLEELKRNGLQYGEKNSIKSVQVNLIETLRDDDIYDFIFVAVRFDQMVSALKAIKNNKSENIVTLANSVGYDEWIAIVGDRLIPGFPGAGGNITEGILYGQFVKNVQGTIFGEINGEKTERIINLARIFNMAELPCEIPENIRAFHLAHAAFTASIKHFYTADGMMDAKTAKSGAVLHKVAFSVKQNVHLLEQASIPILDPKTRVAGKMPICLIMLLFRIMLSIRLTQSVLLGNHALAAREENMQMAKAFREMARTNIVPK
ncbi:MAG: NAD(P)-binding domain-containing protein [Spirochaetaceae bacterium]|jgi:2-dehydropantoate 2-reductase|nr:NAD(P)-binding domain-containing protein [Spirochaetaceae bacterium]